MRLAQRRANPARCDLIAFCGLWLDLRALDLRLSLRRLALHDKRHRPYHGLILAIGDVISHGFLHSAPSFRFPETNSSWTAPGLPGANGTEFQIEVIEISGLACSGRPGKQVQAL